MFDMGFIGDLKRIMNRMPTRRQTLLYSATMPPEIQRLTQEFLFQPREVRLDVSLPPPELSHEVWELDATQKNDALEQLLREDYDSVLVFTRTKHRADSVARRLSHSGEAVAVLHGNRSQNQRDQALARFKQGQARVLVATDVASRGLDIIGIGLIINYDTPRDPDDYVHRVGRTARAKRQGCAVSLVVEDEIKYIRKIEQMLKQRIARRQPGPQSLRQPVPRSQPQPEARPAAQGKPKPDASQTARPGRAAPHGDARQPKPRSQRGRRQSSRSNPRRGR
jgi:ATP-dependent RNA helicase RhlE